MAAVTLPVLITNINERVQKEQVRSAKYKLTLATDKMKSLGLLGEQYPTTQAFVSELSKHLKLAKICDNNHLRECWPTEEINLVDGTTKTVANLKTGADIVALGLGTKNTQTMGIITADGVPMILTYSPNCSPLEAEKTYSWSTVDNKPETNATTNCISAIMDINGNKKPNRIGKDVRTLNSLFGYHYIGDDYSALERSGKDHTECKKLKDKLGINYCPTANWDDFWGGAVKTCHDLGLHLPSTQTLANIAGSRYGRSDISAATEITAAGEYGYSSCAEFFENEGTNYLCVEGNELPQDSNSSVPDQLFNADFWSSSEVSAGSAQYREINWYDNRLRTGTRNYGLHIVFCVGD